ncbi:MAG: FAD-dependent thymidylate synthase, partial [Methanomassiliicoccaceae archaeon]|nr:FAD-dependent thymidylate synthase [Methanomassiliicoccaceae archaeon]
YEELMEHIWKTYRTLSERIPAEDSRYVLPGGCTTNITITMNARELLHFFSIRCCNRAQWEIRDMADRMLEICKTISPVIFKKAGPPCLRGPCPEGKLSCGKPRSELKKIK